MLIVVNVKLLEKYCVILFQDFETIFGYVEEHLIGINVSFIDVKIFVSMCFTNLKSFQMRLFESIV